MANDHEAHEAQSTEMDNGELLEQIDRLIEKGKADPTTFRMVSISVFKRLINMQTDMNKRLKTVEKMAIIVTENPSLIYLFRYKTAQFLAASFSLFITFVVAFVLVLTIEPVRMAILKIGGVY